MAVLCARYMPLSETRLISAFPVSLLAAVNPFASKKSPPPYLTQNGTVNTCAYSVTVQSLLTLKYEPNPEIPDVSQFVACVVVLWVSNNVDPPWTSKSDNKF